VYATDRFASRLPHDLRPLVDATCAKPLRALEPTRVERDAHAAAPDLNAPTAERCAPDVTREHDVGFAFSAPRRRQRHQQFGAGIGGNQADNSAEAAGAVYIY